MFLKIRERRLFQIVASYLAAGWIVLEVTDQFVSRGVAASILYNLVLLAYLCGVPAALLIGWYHGEKGEQKAPRSEIIMLSLIGVVFLSLSSFSVRDYRTERLSIAAAQREAGTDLRKIAVLYFRDHSTGSAYQHVADGLTESLIDELTRVPALEVVTRNGSARFRNSDAARDSIGRTLQVGTLVDGSVEANGDRLRITVRLFDGYSGSEFRSASIDASADEMLEAQQETVEQVARLLRGWLGEEVKVRQSGVRITNARAWTLYQRAERSRKDAESALRAGQPQAAQAAWQRADSLAAQAELLAREWPEPIVLRGHIAYRRSRLADERSQVLALADHAVAEADRALALAATHARALELRGTARYWKYLTIRVSAPHEAETLLRAARADLEEAIRIEPLLASAHSTLSHLLYRHDVSSAVLAARRAYEADAYLDVAADVLFRLIAGNYDIENLDQVDHWCNEAAVRFTSDYRFTECQLLLLTTRQAEPDVQRAWTLLARLDSLAPHRDRAYRRALGTLLVGGVIARASQGGSDPVLADSARAVLARARSLMTPEAVPGTDLHPQAAYMYTLLGDRTAAIELLRQHAAANPHYSFEHHWWWRDLRGTEEFRPLLAQSGRDRESGTDRRRQ